MDSSQAECLALRLSSHPELLSRFSQLLDVVEQVDGDRRTADAAEARTVESLRQLGSEVLHGWASTGVREHESDVDLGSCRRKGNFFYWQSSFGEIGVIEPVFCHKESGRLQPRLRSRFQVECRAHSRHLQRIMTDFGADESFGQASVKVREHYGIEISVKSLGNVRLAHARQFAGQEQESLDEQCPALEEGVKRVILQSDGAMVPVVGIRAGRGDAGKRREAGWKEAKSTLAYEPGRVTPVHAATMKHKDQAGWRMRQVALDAGMGRQTKVHALGDGAVWIEEKVRTHFGERSSYLIDFCHLCEYLAAAVQQAPIQNKPACLGRVKALAKKGQLATLCQWFQKWREPESVPKAEAPVRTLIQCIQNRPGQFDCPNALENRLPIGSGRIESSHRHLIQKRLKIPGAWWKLENADSCWLSESPEKISDGRTAGSSTHRTD